MDDSLYPNDGTYFQPTEPESQVQERRKSVSKSQAGEAILKDLIASIQTDIDQMRSIDAITVDPATDPQEFLKALYAVQQVKQYAIQKKGYMESLLPKR